MNHLIPIIDINKGVKFLSQALLSAQSLRKHFPDVEIVIYDATEKRPADQIALIKEQSSVLSFTYINEVYYPNTYWESHRYTKAVGNRFYGWAYLSKLHHQSFLIQDSDILWLDNVDWASIIPSKSDFCCFNWIKPDKKFMLSDSLFFVRNTSHSRDFVAATIALLTSLDNQIVRDVIKKYDSRGQDCVTSENLTEAVKGMLATQFDRWPDKTSLLRDKFYHYASHKPQRKELFKTYASSLDLKFLSSYASDIDSVTNLVCD